MTNYSLPAVFVAFAEEIALKQFDFPKSWTPSTPLPLLDDSRMPALYTLPGEPVEARDIRPEHPKK